MAATMERTKTPGVYRRGGRYVEVWTYRGRQHKKSHRTYAEARESKARRTGGRRRPESRKTFGSYYPYWIETYTGRTNRGLSDTTRDEYRRTLVTFAVPAWRMWRLGEIDQADIRELLSLLRREGESTSQIRKLRTALSALFATAVEDGLVDRNPVRDVRIPAVSSPDPEPTRRKALTEEELNLLLKVIPEDWRTFFGFLAETGLRISEAIGLRWDHLDLDRTTPAVRVREQFYRNKRRRLKTDNGRRDVPLTEAMRDQLLKLRPAGFNPDSPVFATRTGRPHSPSNIRSRVLDPAAIALGFYVEVPGKDGKPRARSTIGFHTFRHTCASMLFDQGRNVAQVSRWLGHADPAFTLRTYVHLMDDGVGAPIPVAGWQEGGNKDPADNRKSVAAEIVRTA